MPLVLACDGSQHVQGNGRLVESERATATFSAVSASNALHAKVLLADPRVQLTIDENLLALVRTEVRGAVLAVDPAPNHDLEPSPGALITASSPLIAAFDTSGEAQIEGATNAENVSLTAAGDSAITAGTTGAVVIAVNASQSSHVEATGDAERIAIDASGSAEVTLASRAPAVEVEASGAATVTVTATRTVRVRASGSSVVTVFGHPATRDLMTTENARVVWAD